MRCLCETNSQSDIHPLLLQYAAGTLPPEEVEVVAEAIRHCDVCRSRLESLVLDDELIRSLQLPADELSSIEEPECASAVNDVRKMVDQILNPDSDLTRKTDETAYAADASAKDLEIKEIGQYRVREVLGKGGMGTVYKGIHPQLEKVVAIKLLKGDLSKDQSAVARFQREMKAVGRLDHPNIVRATDAGTADGHMFLVMEFVDGVDLRSLVDFGGPLAVPDACELIRQSAVGLYHAHEHGLVHRDIKPNNIRLSRQGFAKILDLGLARVTWDEGTGGEGQLTQTSQICGTYDYMPPEQWESTHHVDHRGDIYSLGCTFYYLLTGHAPFDHPKYQKNYLSKMRAHLLEPAPPIGDTRDDLPADVQTVLDRMLAKEPENRFQSAAEVVYALEPFCQGHRLLALVGSDDRPGSGVITQPLSSPSGVSTPRPDSAVSNSRPPSSNQVMPAASSTGSSISTSQALTQASWGLKLGLIAFGLIGAIGIGALLSQFLNQSKSDIKNDTPPINLAGVAQSPEISEKPNEVQPSDSTTKADEAMNGDQSSADGESTASTTPSTNNTGLLRPTVKAIADATIQEKQRYNLKIKVENELDVKGKYRYALSADAPDGSFVHPETGQFSWTPGEIHGPGEFGITIQLLSQDDAVADASVSWTVKVQEVNDPPVLEQPKDHAIDEMTTVEFIAQAKDPDEPANDIRFELTGDVPEGAVIDPKNGLFTWKPTEAQGPAKYKFTLQVVDDGENSRRDFKTFDIEVKEVNRPPEFAPVEFARVSEEGVVLLGPGERLQLKLPARDDDLPPQKLNYRLGEGAPENARIDADTGELDWSIEPADVGQDFQFDVLATEVEGDEPLSARLSLSFHIERYIENSIGMKLAYIPSGRFKMGNMSGDIDLPGLPGAEDLLPGEQPNNPLNPNKPNVNPLNPNLNPKTFPKRPEYPRDERPVRTIRLGREFHVSAMEVTQRQYLAVMGENPSYYSPLGEGAKDVGEEATDDFPVESVSWNDAVEFCQRLSELPEEKAAGRMYRLPTEAEWEYICRAGKDTAYCTGAAISSKQANFNGTAPVKGAAPGPFLNRTTIVGSYDANDWGIFDIQGNVAEWCQDWYSPKAYEETVFEDPLGPQPKDSLDDKTLDARVIRGGSWSDTGFECRSSRRYKYRPYEKTRLVGFRVVCHMPIVETAAKDAETESDSGSE